MPVRVLAWDRAGGVNPGGTPGSASCEPSLDRLPPAQSCVSSQHRVQAQSSSHLNSTCPCTSGSGCQLLLKSPGTYKMPMG